MNDIKFRLEYVSGELKKNKPAGEYSDHWTISFTNSLLDQVSRGRELSASQLYYFESIEADYGHKAKEDRKIWEENYDEAKRDIAFKVASYYKTTTYFSYLVNKVLSNPDTFIVPEKRWSKFCENKWAKKVLAQYEQEDLFKKGDVVQIRSKNRIGKANGVRTVNLRDKSCVILEANCKPITESFKGSKVYKILIFGIPKPVFAFESDLKRARIKK